MLCRNADNPSSFLACLRKFSSLGMPGVLVHWFDDEVDLLLIRSPSATLIRPLQLLDAGGRRWRLLHFLICSLSNLSHVSRRRNRQQLDVARKSW
jgi:hypothetical protein